MRQGKAAVFAALLSLAQISVADAGESRTTGVGPAGIKGVDNRVVVDSSVAPWNAVGRISTSTGNYCTGVLISADRVATAAHCLWREKTLRWLPVYEISFLAGYRDGKYQERAAIESYFLPNGLVDQKKRRLKKVGDWAVLKLRRAVSSKINQFHWLILPRPFGKRPDARAKA